MSFAAFITTFPSLFATLVMGGLAVFIYLRNPYNLLNKLFITFLLLATLWSGSEFISSLQSSSHMAEIFLRIGALGWGLMGVVFLNFVFVLTRRWTTLNRLFIVVVSIVPSFIFLYLIWRTNYIISYDLMYVGGVWDAPPGPLFWIFASWSLVIHFIPSVWLLATFARETKNTFEKNRTLLILVAIFLPYSVILAVTIIPALLGFISDVQVIIERISLPLSGAFMVAMIAYAILRYRLFVISPTTAISSIISTMNEALILVNPKGFVELANKSAFSMFGYREEEFISSHIKNIFSDTDAWEKFNQECFVKLQQGQVLNNFETTVITKDMHALLLRFSCSVLRDSAGGVAGIILLAIDITRERELIRNLQEAARELGVVKANLERKIAHVTP